MGTGPRVLRKRAGYQSCVAHAQASAGGRRVDAWVESHIVIGLVELTLYCESLRDLRHF